MLNFKVPDKKNARFFRSKNMNTYKVYFTFYPHFLSRQSNKYLMSVLIFVCPTFPNFQLVTKTHNSNDSNSLLFFRVSVRVPWTHVLSTIRAKMAQIAFPPKVALSVIVPI